MDNIFGNRKVDVNYNNNDNGRANSNGGKNIVNSACTKTTTVICKVFPKIIILFMIVIVVVMVAMIALALKIV